MPLPSEYVENGMKLIDALYQSTKDGYITKDERIQIVLNMESNLVNSGQMTLDEGLFDWSEKEQRTTRELYYAIQKAEESIFADASF